MIKKTIILLLSLLPLAAVAQQVTGRWYNYPLFSAVSTMEETPDKLYYLSTDKTLFSYDKNTGENYCYGIDNKLTGADISKIAYNPYGKYLAVVYKSSNIDILYDNGKVRKLTDIADATISKSKTIKHVKFAPGMMLVHTDFGFVLYDSDNMRVKESGIYEQMPFSESCITEQYIVAKDGTSRNLYVLPLGKRLNNIDNFVKTSAQIWSSDMSGLNEDTFVYTGHSSATEIMKLNLDAMTFTAQRATLNAQSRDLTYSKNGVLVASDKALAFIDKDGQYTVVTIASPLPSGSKYCYSAWDGMGAVWAGGPGGVSEYAVADGSAEQLTAMFAPEGLGYQGLGRVYVSPTGTVYSNAFGFSHEAVYPEWKWNTGGYVNIISPDGKFMPGQQPQYTQPNGTKATAKSLYNVVEQPGRPDTYFTCTLYDGIHKIRNGEEVSYYNQNNSTLIGVASTQVRALAIDFDGKGNLWTVNHGLSGQVTSGKVLSTLHCLPADKVDLDRTEVSDWYAVPIKDYPNSGERMGIICAAKHSNIVVAGFYNSMGLLFVDTKGTANPSDDTTAFISDFYDQDGKIINITTPTALTEDKNGQIWVGHQKGVFAIPNPSKFSQPDFRVNHIKVPRNDGTNFADYLLDAQLVSSIAVDSSNRKWLSTTTAGVYYVSADGSTIINHFDTSNSLLPADAIYQVACNPNGNDVYFASLLGLTRYDSDSAATADDFSEVYAYPNPVRPEYHGWIMIKGLMENSLVKIADSAGNVIHQGRSEGGVLAWDGCGLDGRRVKTGVYYVFASSADGQTSEGAVTKILVVK